jgi:hypothetical protein
MFTDRKNMSAMKLRNMIQEHMPDTKIVTLEELTHSISKVANVRVRNRTISKYHELGIEDINEEGILSIPEKPKPYDPANESAIKSQSLHTGDLIFGYRGKLGKIGLVNKEFDIPVVTNSGMIRITFPEDRLKETPRYVQTYLQSNLIRTYLNTTLDENNKLNVETLKQLPIPYFEEMLGVSKFSTLFDRRRKMSIEARKIVKEATYLLEKMEDMESETISLQTLPLEKLSKINAADHTFHDAQKQLVFQLQQLKNTQVSDSLFLQTFH